MDLHIEPNNEENKKKRNIPKPVAVDAMLLTYMLLSRKSVVAFSTSIMGKRFSELEDGQASGNECFVMHIPFHGTC